jgi:hypothetical protein
MDVGSLRTSFGSDELDRARNPTVLADLLEEVAFSQGDVIQFGTRP